MTAFVVVEHRQQADIDVSTQLEPRAPKVLIMLSHAAVRLYY